MKKVDSIESIAGIKKKISDIEQDFFDRVNRVDKARKIPSSPLMRLTKAERKAVGVEKAILGYCCNNYKNIILGSPTQLGSIILHFDGSGWNAYIAANAVFKNKLEAHFGYSSYFRSDKEKGIWYADQLNIKACPYCNAQYTVTTRLNGNPARARFQFDHFFSKARYPYLSISMYNLIPSCPDCNLSKKDEPVNLLSHYHPYHSSICDKMEFQLDNTSVLQKLLAKDVHHSVLKTRCLPNDPVHKPLVEEHCRLYDVEGIYENHSDYAEEILLKSILYPASKRAELMSIKGLFRNEATFLRYVLGNYPYHDDIVKRPLAKFTQDIARQLKLID